MTDQKSAGADDIASKVAAQAPSVEGGKGEQGLQQQAEAALKQGKQSGLLDEENIPDGQMQEKIKKAMMDRAGDGFVGKAFTAVTGHSGDANNPVADYGNKAGQGIEGALKPVGNVVGGGLSQVTKPVGSVLDPVVGGLMRSGGAFGETVGVGAGNMDQKKQRSEEDSKTLNTKLGGNEQTGGNPLGL